MNFISIFDGFWNLSGPLLNALAAFFTSHAGIFLYCAGIVIWAISAAIIFHRRITPVQSQIKKANEALKESDHGNFANKFHELDAVCSKLPVLVNSWREFTEVLLFPGTDFEDGEQICNTRRPGTYLSQRTILWPLVSMRFYNALPNMLTGLGILGTFIGLVAGISLAAPGLNSSDINDAKNALEKLLSGASLAFLTSIFGLISSIFFSWYEKKRVYGFDKLLYQFVEGLDERLEYISIEKISSKALLESQKQTASLESFSNDLAVSLGDLLENKITEPMNSTMIDLGKIMEEQKTILEGLREDQQKVSDETLERLIEKFSESISASAGKEMRAFGETIVTLSKGLENQIAIMSKGQAAMQKASQESVQILQESFKENTKHLQEQVSTAISTMVEGVRETVGDMTRMLQEATKESAENMQEVSRQFDESITTLKDTVYDMSEINQGTQKILSELDKLTEAINQSQDELFKAAVPIQEAAAGLQETSSSIKDAAGMMNETGTHLKNNIEAIQTTHEDLKQSWNSYQQRFENVDSSLAKIFEGLEQGLATYASSTKKYVEELDQHASQVVTHLAGATSELGEGIEGLEEVIESMQTSMKTNVTHLAGATTELGEGIKGLGHVLDSMKASMKTNAHQ